MKILNIYPLNNQFKKAIKIVLQLISKEQICLYHQNFKCLICFSTKIFHFLLIFIKIRYQINNFQNKLSSKGKYE